MWRTFNPASPLGRRVGAAGQGFNPGNPPRPDLETILLLHNDGADGSPLFPDSALGGLAPHTTLAQGDAQVDTAQKQFGTGSALFDGNDRVEITTGLTDFDFGGNPFTIEVWLYRAVGGIDHGLISKGGGVNGWNATNGHQWILYMLADNKIYFSWYTGGVGTSSISSGGVDLTDGFHHIAVSQDASNIRLFLDGVQVAIAGVATISEPTTRDKMRVGNFPSDDLGLSGWEDEIRILTRAEYTTTPFVVPIAPFSPYL